jgi:hypothetical protein
MTKRFCNDPGHVFNIGAVKEQSRITDDLGNCRGVRRDHRQPMAKSFQQGQPKAFE